MLKTRKRRSDRNHVLYVITNTVTNEQYLGLTGVTSTVKRTLKRRMQKHLQRALAENKVWGLCESLRTHGPEVFTYGLLEIVRGKREAHARETELIKQYNPKLNTFGVK
jgi:hypothetical protein